MECVEAAAAQKASLRAEIMAFRSWAQDQSSNNDDWSASGAVAGSSGDEFFVDGLFDFSNEDIVGEFVQDENEDEDEEDEDAVKEYGSSVFTSADENSNSSVSFKDDFDAELSFPTDDFAHLEWLSHFVEDSFTQFPCPSGPLPYAPKENATAAPAKKKSNRTNILGFSMGTQVPAKARTKRERTCGRVWSFRSPQSTESSSSSSSPSLSSTASWPSDSCLIYYEAAHNLDHFGRPPSKKKKPAGPVQERKNPGQQPQRRCSHCLVQKTPQWRNGPLGAKTLCNACGVRYKSGRLFPEYRPATSPTFLSHVHSNHHRKVLEMRRKKEMVPHGKPGLAAAVESF